jgi:hypothetical protein
VTAPLVRASVDRRFLATAMLAAFVLFSFAARLRVHSATLSGDEPAYLVISQTVQKYHSFNVMLDYQNQDYRSFFHAPLEPHVVFAPDGTPQPIHGVGGPLLWLVPFILWGRGGAIGFLVAVSMLVIGNLYAFLRERQIRPEYALFTTLLFVIGSPIYMYSGMSFIEPIATLFVLYAVRVLFAHRLHPVRLTVASLALGYLPWVHPRLVTFSLMIGAALAARCWLDRSTPRLRSLTCALVPLLVGLVAIEVDTWINWGTLNPGVTMAAIGNRTFGMSPVDGVAGLLLDREYGLFPNFPLFLLVLPGLLLTLHGPQRVTTGVLTVLAGPYALLICTFLTWFAGASPPARFLTVLVPLFGYPIAFLLQRLRNWWVLVGAASLAVASYALSLASDVWPGERYLTPVTGPISMNRIGRMIGFPFAHYLPSMFLPGQMSRFLVWAAFSLGR